MTTATKQRVSVTTQVETTKPPLFRVIYVNDNVTPMDYVIASLIKFFNYNEQDATDMTIEIHNNGSAVVAVLPYEIAEEKGVEATLHARQQRFPLQIKLEPDV